MFRPCIDLHEGKVKQIVGGSLTGRPADLRTHFVSEKPSRWFAELYRRDGLRGGHVIMLGPGNDAAAREALAAWPGGLQVGGGIGLENAAGWLEAGASHVIVTSWIFRDGQLDWERLKLLARTIGQNRLVLDLSCRKKGADYFVVTDRWQKFTDLKIEPETLDRLGHWCDEFLVHAADVEGLCRGIDLELVGRLGRASPRPATYAGGANALRDLEDVARAGGGRINLTIGSALDIFGGSLVRYHEVVALDRKLEKRKRNDMKYRYILGFLLAAALLPRAGAQSSNAPEAGLRGRRNAERAASAAKPDEAKNAAPPAPKDKDKEPKDELTETTNTVTIDGVEVRYKATAGTIVVKDEEGKALVSFFFIAYTSLDATNASERPLTFSFNGGPGSASLWLHLGLLGPRRVFMKEDGSLPPPPFRLVNNNESLLDRTDLVFLDPVSTGFTRTVPGEDASKYHGVDQDLRSVGDFIRLYSTRYDRWLSPKFLIGESYGTTRASGLAGYLEDRYGLYLNGIALVSAVLDFSTISFNPGNDLPYILYLPTETATAWYHKKLAPDLQADRAKALDESQKFALGPYTLALMQGTDLPAAQRADTIKELARLTGLSEDYIDRDNMRVRASQFFKELLRKERLTVGRYDSRMTGEDRDSVGETPDYDPSYTTALGPFAATFNDYVRRELKFQSDLPYEVLTGKVQPWDFNQARNRYLDIAENLREAMTHNPYLKIFVANGHYDLATPYLATRYTFDHMGLPPDLRDNVSMGYYEAGHMMYLNTPSRIALKKDLAKFIRSATPAN